MELRETKRTQDVDMLEKLLMGMHFYATSKLPHIRGRNSQDVIIRVMKHLARPTSNN